MCSEHFRCLCYSLELLSLLVNHVCVCVCVCSSVSIDSVVYELGFSFFITAFFSDFSVCVVKTLLISLTGFVILGSKEADLVLGGDEGDECTYAKGYMKRQAIFSCITCNPEGNAGLCTACCLSCHDGHEVCMYVYTYVLYGMVDIASLCLYL